MRDFLLWVWNKQWGRRLRQVLLISCALWLAMPGLAGRPAWRAAAASRPGATWTVTVEADSGPGSLRYALEHAHLGDIILFDVTSFPPATPTTIHLLSELPPILNNNVTIDASNAGVILDGSAIAGTPDGLRVEADNDIISGLEIINFGGNGIVVTGDYNRIGGSSAAYGNVIADNGDDGIEIGGNGNLVWANLIGTDAGGADRGNGGNGLKLTGNATDNTIGGDGEKRNVISANGDSGVSLSGTGVQNNLIAGNLIGLAPDGSNALGNASSGVSVYGGATGNFIGGSGAAQRNVVSGNGWGGIVISTAYSTTVMANYVGLDVTGSFAVPNALAGIMVKTGAQYNAIGGIGESHRNVVAGNAEYGISLYGEDAFGNPTAYNTVLNNIIGTSADNTVAVPNGLSGIKLDSGAGDNTVGPDNCIAGNTSNGIIVNGSDNNIIKGNRIGVRDDGVQAIPNGRSGVYLRDARYNQIGVSGDGNIISGNGFSGVEMGSGAHSNTVTDNWIGLNGDGTGAIANQLSGVSLWGGSENDNSNNVIGPDNVISGNTSHGVYIERAHDNVIEGNIIGLSRWGTSEVPNGGHGVMISDAYNNRIGNTVHRVLGQHGAQAELPDVGNVISGNGGDGVHISGPNSSGNAVYNNYIGTEQDGTGDRANGGNGVTIRAGATTSRIGLGDGRNAIVHNAGAGVWIDNADGNQVTGNWIGINGAGEQAGNLGHGVVITNSAASNFVGFAASGLGNTISGNGGHGVYVYGAGSSSNIISNNTIGANPAGDSNVPNGGSGVVLEAGADNNQVGGDGSAKGPGADGNVISGNIGHGVLVSNVLSSVVAANYIGTDQSGAAGVGNGGSGVVIQAGSLNTTVDGNLISGNGQHGLLISDAATQSNTATGNIIGLRAAGDSELPNGGNGVQIDQGASHNVIGSLADGNVISGNSNRGILIDASSENTIRGNFIGTTASGDQAAGNGSSGIGLLHGATDNAIGNGGRNVISGNGLDGIYLGPAANTGNEIVSNLIGLNATGASILPNGRAGIYLSGDSDNNTIGGSAGNTIAGNVTAGIYLSGASDNVIANNLVGCTASSALGGHDDAGIVIENSAGNQVQANQVSGNAGNGIAIRGSGAMSNTLAANVIGANSTGVSALPNGGAGVAISGGAHGNTLGGLAAGSGNTISGNTGNGVAIQGLGSDDNALLRNRIGAQAGANVALPNGGHGVSIWGGAQGTIIGGLLANTGNLIAYNGGHGVLVSGASTLYHTIQRNSIHDNSGAGIKLASGGNAALHRPRVSDRLVAAGQVEGSAPPGSTVRIFSDAAEEGAVYEGSTTANAGGHFTFDAGAALTGPNITATATDAAGNTSEFGCYFADIDCDNDVDAADVTAVASRWNLGQGEAGYTYLCDLDGDGDVDVVDVQLAAGRWGWPG